MSYILMEACFLWLLFILQRVKILPRAFHVNFLIFKEVWAFNIVKVLKQSLRVNPFCGEKHFHPEFNWSGSTLFTSWAVFWYSCNIGDILKTKRITRSISYKLRHMVMIAKMVCIYLVICMVFLNVVKSNMLSVTY